MAPSLPYEQPAAGVPETADLYRSLVENLRRAFGGTIDDANADAIAFAAAELYHKDVEPRLWEQKGAQELLDSFGVPRAGAFSRYSLTDRLLLLRGSATPDRIQQAHTLLDELGAPGGSGQDGSRPSLKERLEWLLEAVQSPPPSLRPVTAAANGSAPDRNGPAPEQLVDALATIRQVATGEDPENGLAVEPPPPPSPAAADLAGLATLVATMQEELIRLRQTLETVETRLDEALSLLRTGDGDADPPSGSVVFEAEPVDAEPPADAEADALVEVGAGAEPGAVEDGAEPGAIEDGAEAVVDPDPPPAEVAEMAAAEAHVAGPDNVTQAVPVVPVEIEAARTGSRRRRWGLPKLVVIAVLLGLMVAGAAIFVSAVGWNEVRDTLNIGGWIDIPWLEP